MRDQVRVVAVLAVLAVLAACTPAAPPAATSRPAQPAPTPGGQPSGAVVKIGFLTPLSGPAAAYGALLKAAPQLVMDEVNASGGINGSRLEVVTVDSPNNPNQALTSVAKLVNDDKVLAIAGPYFTGEAEVVAPRAEQLQVPIAFNALKPGIVSGNKWAFQFNIPDDRNLPVAIGAFKKVYPDVHKVVVVGDVQTAVTSSVIKDLWPKLLPQAGYSIVDTVTYDASTTDFSAIATRIKGSGADGMALSSLSPAAPNLLRELQRQGVTLPIVSSEHLQTVPPFPEIAGSTAEGMIMPFSFDPSRAGQDARVKDWLTRYEAAVQPGPSGQKPAIGYALEPLYYDLLSAMVKSMRDGGVNGSTPLPQAREAIRGGLEALKDYHGIGGTISAGADHVMTWPIVPLIVRDTKWQPIP
jgi:branched-chain amino acid transport system substrate-binding protein